MKICSICKLHLDLDFFYRSKSKKDSHHACCKSCTKEQNRLYNLNNKEKISAHKKIYEQQNKEILTKKYKAYHLKNKEKRNKGVRIYYLNNKEQIKKQKQIYQNMRLKDSTNYKLRHRLRSRLSAALKNNQKTGSAVRDLGCTINELKEHLEKQFKEGMSWDNWGFGDDKWHIDHIKPLASFDLTNREQFLEAVNFKNLQPLWQFDNLRKNKFYEELEAANTNKIQATDLQNLYESS